MLLPRYIFNDRYAIVILEVESAPYFLLFCHEIVSAVLHDTINKSIALLKLFFVSVSAFRRNLTMIVETTEIG